MKPAQQRWTDDERGLLLGLKEAGWAAPEIARELDRSYNSVAHQWQKLQRGWSPRLVQITPQDLEFIRITRHLTAREVAEHLRLSPGAVERRRNVLARTEGLDFSGSKDPFDVGTRRLIARTCLGCGLLLDALWFTHKRGPGSRSKAGGRYWQARCVRCIAHTPGALRRKAESDRRQRSTERMASKEKRRREGMQRLQAFSLPTSTRGGQPWLDADHLTLRDPDLTLLEKALRLNRTYMATRHKCHEEGYVSKVGRGDPVRGRWVIDNPNAPAGRDVAA